MGKLTPLRQRAATAVRNRGQLVVPNRYTPPIDPVVLNFWTIGENFSNFGWDAGVYGDFTPTPPPDGLVRLYIGSAGVLVAKLGSGGQWNGATQVTMTIIGYGGGAIVLDWNAEQSDYATLPDLPLYAYVQSQLGNALQVTFEDTSP